MNRKLLSLIVVLLLALAAPVVMAQADADPATGTDVSPLGTEFRISYSDEELVGSVGNGDGLQAIDADSNGDAVVLMFEVSPQWSLQVRLYDPLGAPKGPQFLVADDSLGDVRGADVAMDADGDFIVVWEGVYARLYSATGAPKGPAFAVSESGVRTEAPAVAVDDAGNFVVVWVVRYDAGGYGVMARRFWANGQPRGPEFVVAPTVNYYDDYGYDDPDAAMDADGDFALSWIAYTPDVDGGQIQRYSAAGVAQGAPIPLPGTWGVHIAADAARNFVAVWQAPDQSEQGIFARRFLANGTAAGPAFQVNTAADSWQGDTQVDMNASGEFYITWTWDYAEQQGQNYAGSAVYGRRYAATGAPLGDQFRVQTYPWGGEGQGAIDDQGDFLTAWNSQQNGGNGGVYGQLNYPTHPNIPILVSLLNDGKVRGLAYRRGDILKYDPAADRWSMFWDASDHGVATANVGDFELLDDGDLLLVFKSIVSLPGPGKVQPHDIVRFDAATGAYSLYFDGSDAGLTTLGERLDAVALEPDGSLLLSTSGGFAVPELTGVDENIIRFQPASLGPTTDGVWTSALYRIGRDQYKDVWSLWMDSVSPDPYYYMTFERPVRVLFSGPDVFVPNGGVMRCRPIYPQLTPFEYSYCLMDLYWSGAAAGLPATAKIDGLELVTRP